MRRSNIAALIAFGVMALIGCDADGLDPLEPTPCVLEPVLSGMTLGTISEADLTTALIDAAQRTTHGLSDQGPVEQLRIALTAVGAGAMDERCNALKRARAQLALQRTDAASAPDRASLSLLLDIAQTYLALLQ
jgi:hypothetical protein